MSTDTPEQRELTLVGKVELRIALADSDTKLQSLLNTYLPPLLLKLASVHEKVRFAVREELSKRYLRVASSVLLPPLADKESIPLGYFHLSTC